jgi:hypothetical protein
MGNSTLFALRNSLNLFFLIIFLRKTRPILAFNIKSSYMFKSERKKSLKNSKNINEVI